LRKVFGRSNSRSLYSDRSATIGTPDSQRKSGDPPSIVGTDQGIDPEIITEVIGKCQKDAEVAPNFLRAAAELRPIPNPGKTYDKVGAFRSRRIQVSSFEKEHKSFSRYPKSASRGL
jgi:hypothetical protein